MRHGKVRLTSAEQWQWNMWLLSVGSYLQEDHRGVTVSNSVFSVYCSLLSLFPVYIFLCFNILWADPFHKVWHHINIAKCEADFCFCYIIIIRNFPFIKRKFYITYSYLAWWWSIWQVVGSIPVPLYCLPAWRTASVVGLRDNRQIFWPPLCEHQQDSYASLLFLTQTKATSALGTCSWTKSRRQRSVGVRLHSAQLYI